MLTPDDLDAFRRALSSLQPLDELPPMWQQHLMFRGMVALLQLQADEPAIALLEQICRQGERSADPALDLATLALSALNTLAAQENTAAREALFNLAVQGNHAPALACLLERNYTSQDSRQQAAFHLFSRQMEALQQADPCLLELAAAYQMASADQQRRMLEAARKNGLPHWAAIVSAVQAAEAEQLRQQIVAPFNGFNENERSLTLNLLELAALGGSQNAQEALCQLFLEYDHPRAGELTRQYGYAPQEMKLRAVFYFLNGQWEAYESVDFQHTLLGAAYAEASPGLRQRLLAHSRQTGYLDWLSGLTSGDRQRWLKDMTDADWESSLRDLHARQRHTDLWRLAQVAAPIWSARFLAALQQAQWQPEKPEEQENFQRLCLLATACAKKSFTIEPHRTYQSSQPDITCGALSADGSLLAAGSSDPAIHLWRLPDGGQHPLHILSPAAQTRALVISPDKAYLIAASSDNQIRVFRMEDGRLVKVLGGHAGLLRTMQIQADGRTLYSAGFDGVVSAWRFPLGGELWKQTFPERELFTLAVSLDAEFLLVAGSGQVIHVLRLPDGQLLRDLPGHHDTILSMALSPAAQHAASFSRDGELRLWNYSSGRCLQTIQQSGSPITQLAFHPQGKLLAGAAHDGKLTLWNTSTGQQTIQINSQGSPVSVLAFTPDGKTLITANARGKITQWDLSTLLITRKPIGISQPEDTTRLDKKLERETLPPAERAWLNFTLELSRWKQRYDVEISEPVVIQTGEFDIQL